MTSPTSRRRQRPRRPEHSDGLRRQRSDGARSRRAILAGATALATVEGLEGLSIGRLAEHIGMSKSGLYAHFGSKEELQLATIDEAQEIFEREVVHPTLDHPPGVEQLLAFCDAYLSHLERRVFPGGCFFASVAAEVATHEGRVRDRLRDFMAGGLQWLAEQIHEAQARGELDADADSGQLAFEIDSLLHGAHASFMLYGSEEPLERARRAIRARLGRP